MKIKLITPKQETEEYNFEELLKKTPYTILYFYPKDNTPGCTTEAIDFSNHTKTFQEKNIQIIGVSKDSEISHCKFIDKHSLTIPFISDPELNLHKKYGAWGEKKNYGKTYMGTIRSTFLLDQSGQIIQERKNVRAKGHVEKVLKELSI